MTHITDTKPVQTLLARAGGRDNDQGDPRLKNIVYDLLEHMCRIIEKHDISETELWTAIDFLGRAHQEYGLIVPGLGIEHFMDLVLDERDRAAGALAGTPRTIEGPLYVEGAPLCQAVAVMSDDEDEGERLIIRGTVTDTGGGVVSDAVVDVWHADTRGFYSHFDPTDKQKAFNNRRRIKVDREGHYEVQAIMPVGYSVPPDGATDRLMKMLGRHGGRPAHVHFFVDAPGYRHLTTQLNIADDPLVHDDFAFGTREGLIPDIDRSGDHALIRFDLVVTPKHAAIVNARSDRPRLSV